ncbi:MAG: Abi family protein [Bacteroidales bacterium]|nr:Abi family protein [Bacteroidales bacterium]
MEYTKRSLSISQQIQQLKDRGLIIADDDFASRILSNVSYFRLANYMRTCEIDLATHQFKQGTTFESIIKMYDFDTELRNLLFTAIQTIEISFRTKLIHIFSQTYGAFWYVDMNLTNDGRKFLENLSALDREISRSKEDFIKEHFQKYDKPAFPPVWKSLELATFGILSKFYFNFADIKLKKQIARELGLPQHLILESWITTISAMRNYCAHHSRIWNRSFPSVPELPKNLKNSWITDFSFPTNKVYAQIVIIAYLQNVIKDGDTFTKGVMSLMKNYTTIDPFAMGFPKCWQTEPMWSI